MAIKTEKKMNNVIKKIIKWALLLFSLVIVVLLLLQTFEIIHSWSFFFGFFQLYFNWDIWIIRIISLVTVLIFSCYILPSIKDLFNPLKPFSKKRIPAIIFVCFLSVLWFITHLSVKDQNFDALGRGLTSKAWAIDHYEDVASHYTVHPIYGTPAIKVTPDNISVFSLRKIEIDDNTVFFSPVDGTPLIYYYTMGSKVEFFNSKGRHPQYGEELLPVTPDFIKSYFLQIEADKKQAEEEELIMQQELEKQRQEKLSRQHELNLKRQEELGKQQYLDSRKQVENLLARQKELERQIESEKKNTREQLRQQELENKKQIDNLLAKQKEIERQQVSNPAPSTTQRVTTNAADSTNKWVDKIEYYPEVRDGKGGVTFINHSEYVVLVTVGVKNHNYNLDIATLNPNESTWAPYHFSLIYNVRVKQLW